MNLDELRFVSEAWVYKAGRRAGSLTRHPDGVEFTYAARYSGTPVASTLPLSADAPRRPGGAVPPYFAGLLPEGRRLAALRRSVKTSADDELSLLLAVGADAVGDVQVVPVGEAPVEPASSLDVTRWSDVDFSEVWSMATGDRIDRVALPGVQDKVSARMMTAPVRRRGERFILKLDPPEFPHLVENEAFFLRAARDCGLRTVDATVVRDTLGRPGLLVRRFDRISRPDGTVQMLAVEDGCQVLARYPADKYTVSFEEVASALSRLCQARVVAALDLLRIAVFAYITCNGDAHAKNFSVVHSDGEWRTAPAYDLPSSHPYGDRTMALTFGGKLREDITRRTVHDVAAAFGVASRATDRMIDRLLAGSEAWLDRLAELPFDEQRVRNLERAVRYRRDRLVATGR